MFKIYYKRAEFIWKTVLNLFMQIIRNENCDIFVILIFLYNSISFLGYL